jgi:hypothetical protein
MPGGLDRRYCGLTEHIRAAPALHMSVACLRVGPLDSRRFSRLLRQHFVLHRP